MPLFSPLWPRFPGLTTSAKMHHRHETSMIHSSNLPESGLQGILGTFFSSQASQIKVEKWGMRHLNIYSYENLDLKRSQVHVELTTPKCLDLTFRFQLKIAHQLQLWMYAYQLSHTRHYSAARMYWLSSVTFPAGISPSILKCSYRNEWTILQPSGSQLTSQTTN